MLSDLLAQWPEFDKEILGGNYTGHYGHQKTGTDVKVVPGMENHPILKGGRLSSIVRAGSIKPPAPYRQSNDSAVGKQSGSTRRTDHVDQWKKCDLYISGALG